MKYNIIKACHTYYYYFSFQQGNEDIKTKRELIVNKKKHPGETPLATVVQQTLRPREWDSKPSRSSDWLYDLWHIIKYSKSVK